MRYVWMTLLLLVVAPVSVWAAAPEIPYVKDYPFVQRDVSDRYPLLEIDAGKVIEYTMWAIERDNWPGVETPHVAWAKPLAGKRPEVLFIVSSWRGNMRDVKEIEARLDCNVHMLALPGRSIVERMGTAVERYLNQKAAEHLRQRYDVIIANQQVMGLSEELQRMILGQVEQGTGLIYQWCYQREPNLVDAVMPFECKLYVGKRPWEVTGDSFITSGIPFEILPPTRLVNGTVKEEGEVLATMGDMPLLVAGQHGQGRTLAILNYAWGLPPYPEFDGVDHLAAPPRYWEYVFSFLSRAILWAADWEPPVRLSLPPARATQQLDQLELSVGLQNDQPQAQQVSLELQVRDDQYQEVGEPLRQTLELGAQETESVTLVVPRPLRNGLHFLDVTARNSAGEVMDWGSTTVRVEPIVSLEVTAIPEVLSPGDEVRIRIRSEGSLPQGQTAWLRTEIWDTWDRCLLQKRTQAAAEGWHDFVRFSTLDLQGVEFRVVSWLENDPGPLSRAETYFYLPDPGWDDYINIMWSGYVRNYFLPDMYRIYKSVCVDSVLIGMWEHSVWGIVEAYRANVRVHGHGTGAELRSFDREEEMSRLTRKVQTGLEYARRYGVCELSLADEPHGTSPLELKGDLLPEYQAYLRERYDSLEVLNQQWDTAYANFDEIEPMYLEEAKQRSNPAAWLEYRMFEDTFIADYTGEVIHQWREGLGWPVDIEYDGTFGLTDHVIPYGRLDYQKMVTAGVNSWLPYNRGQMLSDFLQGWASQWYILRGLLDGPMGNSWLGYGMDPQPIRQLPWAGAAHGAVATGYYIAPCFIMDTGAVLPRGRLIDEPTRQLRQGVGKMLIHAQLEPGEVALFFDQPSFYLQWLMGKREDIDMQLYRLSGDARAAWEFLLMDSQVPFSWVTADMVNHEGLRGKRLLILPGVWRMSEQTAQSLRRWVEEGGVLVADLAPAIYNEHGQPLSPGLLDDLFGFRRNRLSLETVPGNYTIGNFHDDGRFVLGVEWFRPEVYETDIEVTDGRALGQHIVRDKPPALILKRTGEGAALYLNWFETFYQRYRDYRVRRLMRALLSLAEVEPQATVQANGEILPFYRVSQLYDGPIQHVGLLRSVGLGASHPEEVELHLPQARYCYDVREEEYLGYGTQVPVSLRPGEGKIVTCLPYRIEGLTLTVPSSARRGEVLKVSAQLQCGGEVPPGDHILRLEVYDPEGELVEALTSNLRAPRGQLHHHLLMAANAAPGTWRVRVIDPISHVQAEKQVQVVDRGIWPGS